MIIYNALFYTFGLLLIASSIGVVSAKNTVYSVLLLIFAFFNAAGIFVMLGAEFLAMSLIIVYVGAVAVLFLFVVMTVNIESLDLRLYINKNYKFLVFLSLLLVAELIICVILFNGSKPSEMLFKSDVYIDDVKSNTEQIALVLYTNYGALLQIAGLILFAAMIGAICLTHRKTTRVKRQNPTNQNKRNKSNSVKLVNVKKGGGVDVIRNF